MLSELAKLEVLQNIDGGVDVSMEDFVGAVNLLGTTYQEYTEIDEIHDPSMAQV